MDASIIHLSWSATTICALALVAFTVAIVVSLVRTLQQRQRLNVDASLVRQAKNAELAITLQQTLTDRSIRDREVKWHSVRVARIVQESADVRSFYLVDVRSDTLPTFLPGQHLLLERPGGRISQVAYRCYSLSDDNNEGYWRITVKKANDHPTSVSRWLHEEVTEGDVLRVRGPAGAFFLRSCTARNAVFLSAGVGITPMVPMLLQASRRPHGSIHFLVQYRNTASAPLAERILSFAKSMPSARVQMWFSHLPEDLQSNGSSVIQLGKFSGANVCHDIEELDETDFYLCGPELWLHKLRQELLDLGAAEENIHFELFHADDKGPENEIGWNDGRSAGLAGARSNPLSSSNTDLAEQGGRGVATQSCSVHFRQSNRMGEFSNNVPNLLALAAKSEVPINSGCRTGACGSCAVRLLQGKVRYTRKPQYSLKPAEILPCVCVPEGNIVVDA